MASSICLCARDPGGEEAPPRPTLCDMRRGGPQTHLSLMPLHLSARPDPKASHLPRTHLSTLV